MTYRQIHPINLRNRPGGEFSDVSFESPGPMRIPNLFRFEPLQHTGDVAVRVCFLESI